VKREAVCPTESLFAPFRQRNIVIQKTKLWTRQAMYVQHIIEARSRNHCCSGKSNKYYILWVCVCSLSYPACNGRAPYCHMWPAPFYKISPHYLINGTIFEKTLLNTKCVFWFPLQCLSETFLILRIIERDTIKNYIGLHAKYPLFLSDFNDTWIFTIVFFSKKSSYIKFHENPSSCSRVDTCELTDAHIWRS
jgi:hypothetical protein